MSFSKIHSAQISFLEPKPVDIEIDISRGLYSFTIVGLGDKAVEEAKDRVSSAIKNAGYKSPKQKSEKIVVSLAPAYSKKHGPLFDVAIALGYLEATGEIDITTKNKRLFLGELALDGSLRYIHGALPLTKWAKENGYTEIFIPETNAKEAAVIDGIAIYGAKTLWEIIQHVKPNSKTKIQKQPQTILTSSKQEDGVSFGDIKGQQMAKRGLLIAASGAHNVALYGPPGTGKTLLAKAFRSIIPNMTKEEMFSTTAIYSSAGQLKENVITNRPFRSPHHSASYAAMCGGGTNINPGEITLAHLGILFLDEFPEFERKVIDSLRQPLEDGVICISRASGSVTYPANFTLIATMNPCPCGYKDTGIRSCNCSPSQVTKYTQKISGPIVDRIDMWIEVGNVSHEDLLTKKIKRGSTVNTKELTTAAHIVQNKRQNKLNSQIHTKEIEKYCNLSKPVMTTIKEASLKLELSARAVHKLIKIARTIADLDMKSSITEQHVLEALQFRKK
jgi:magnesium chelatase family protein